MGLKDYVSAINTNKLKLVEYKKEFDDIYTFTFELQTPIQWKSGQHGALPFPIR